MPGWKISNPFCQNCHKVKDLWMTTNNQLVYVCPDKCGIGPDDDMAAIYGTQISNENTYVNNCWKCDSYIDSRLPHLCPREITEGRNDLFKCPQCGESMKNFKGQRPVK